MAKRTNDQGVIDPFDNRTWSGEEKDYFRAIDSALESKENRYISNGRPEHAAFLVHRFLTHADEVVRIYSGNLSRTHGDVDVYGHPSVVDAAYGFLKRGGRIKVVVQKPLDVPDGTASKDHPFARAASDQCKGSLVIKKVGSAEQALVPNYHWMVMDTVAYRLETDIENARAHANFGDPKFAEVLASAFDDILYENAATTLFDSSKDAA